MFPRNIRRIHPWKVAQILTLIMENLRHSKWDGNQSLQNRFCKALEQANLKKPGVQYDPRSGGPRTYEAQLKCLGLIFKRQRKDLHLTLAGVDLVNGSPPLPILQAILLAHQYPSAYGNLSRVKMDPRLKVKPFLFLLHLLHDDRLKGYLLTEEIAVPVVYGHNEECLDFCVEKILRMRLEKINFSRVIDSDQDTHLLRTTTPVKKINNILDIANTFKNCLQACVFVNVFKVKGRESIEFNDEFEGLYEDALKRVDQFIPHYNNEESFQRSYGAWDRIKDTRSISESASIPGAIAPDDSIIIAKFFELCGQQAIDDIPETFFTELSKNYGFTKEKVEKAIEPYLNRSLTYFEATFLELSRSGKSRAIDFEKAICNLFQQKLHFHAKHTGQQKRPIGKIGGYTDVFVIALDDQHCAIIDAKATSSYEFPASDYNTMKSNYIPNYCELTDPSKKLEFCLYVAGGFHRNVEYKLKSLKSETGTPVSSINASDLLKIAGRNLKTTDQSKVRRLFRENYIANETKFNDL
jgi:hypothetical protein